MFTATVAEILHAKDPMRFAALIRHLIEVGLLSPQAAAGDSWFVPVEAIRADRDEMQGDDNTELKDVA